MKTYLLKFLIIILYVSFYGNVFAQADDFPYYVFMDNPREIELKRYKGFAITKQKDTLRGEIRLNQIKEGKESVEVVCTKDTKFIPIYNLMMVRLFNADTTILETNHTDFYVFGRESRLYRLLADSNFMVFDNLPFVNEKINSIGNEIFIKENETLLNTFNFWTLNTKMDLIRYLNKRHNRKFKKGDFKNVLELVRFIAVQEN
jgi:hypothetical protein